MTEDAAKQKAGAGWYIDKRWPNEQRRWDGQRWLDDWRPLPLGPNSGPGAWMLIGFLLSIAGGLLTALAFVLDDTFGWWVLWIAAGIAGTVFNIGVIAKAVEVGVRSSRR